MLLMMHAGCPPDQYRRMTAALADALTERELERRKLEADARAEARDADMRAVLGHIGSAVKAVGGLQRGLRALQDTIARRPSL